LALNGNPVGSGCEGGVARLLRQDPTAAVATYLISGRAINRLTAGTGYAE